MFKKLFLVILFLGLLRAFAIVEYQKIGINEAIEIAYKNNLDILAPKLNIDTAKNEIKIFNRLQNPALTSYWNFGKSGKGNPNTIGIAQNIELFKRGARKDYAKVNFELIKDEFEYEKFKLKTDVKKAYMELVVSKTILKKYEHQQKFLENLLEIAYRNKDINTKDLDSIEAKIALNQMITEVNKIKTNEKIARINFNKAINSLKGNYDSIDFEAQEGENFLNFNSNKDIPSLEEIENTALEKRFDLKIAQKQIELARKNLSNVTRKKIPDIELMSGYSYQSKAGSGDNTFKSGSFLEANIINIPILYTYKPEIQNAKLEIEQANLNYVSTLNKAKKDIEIAYENFITAKINLERYNKTIIKDSDELFGLFEKTYSKEHVDFASLAAIEESYSDIIRGYCEALNDYYTNRINLERELNFEIFKIGDNI